MREHESCAECDKQPCEMMIEFAFYFIGKQFGLLCRIGGFVRHIHVHVVVMTFVHGRFW